MICSKRFEHIYNYIIDEDLSEYVIALKERFSKLTIQCNQTILMTGGKGETSKTNMHISCIGDGARFYRCVGVYRIG